MERKNLLIGILRSKGLLMTTSGKVRLIERRKGARSPESDTAFCTEKVGKMVLVTGNLSNEVLSPVTGSLINSLAEKGPFL